MSEVSKGLLILYFTEVYITSNNAAFLTGSLGVKGKQSHALL